MLERGYYSDNPRSRTFTERKDRAFLRIFPQMLLIDRFRWLFAKKPKIISIFDSKKGRSPIRALALCMLANPLLVGVLP